MKALAAFLEFMERISRDARIGPIHISLYTALFNGCCNAGGNNVLTIDAVLMMQTAKLSRTSFYQVLRELEEFGYIKYNRATSKWEASTVSL